MLSIREHLILLNVPINKYFTDDTEYGAAFDYCGTDYYIDRERLSILDSRIKTYTNAGIHVYLNILLTAPDESQPKCLDCLYSADTSSSVTYYAVNSSDKTALRYFEAFMAFLADDIHRRMEKMDLPEVILSAMKLTLIGIIIIWENRRSNLILIHM